MFVFRLYCVRCIENDGRGDFGARNYGNTEIGPIWDTFDNRRRDEQIQSIRPNQSPIQTLQLGKCVRAVLNCCSRSNNVIRYACFEQRGCHGAFWDLNPCNNDVIDAALGQANRFL